MQDPGIIPSTSLPGKPCDLDGSITSSDHTYVGAGEHFPGKCGENLFLEMEYSN